MNPGVNGRPGRLSGLLGDAIPGPHAGVVVGRGRQETLAIAVFVDAVMSQLSAVFGDLVVESAVVVEFDSDEFAVSSGKLDVADLAIEGLDLAPKVPLHRSQVVGIELSESQGAGIGAIDSVGDGKIGVESFFDSPVDFFFELDDEIVDGSLAVPKGKPSHETHCNPHLQEEGNDDDEPEGALLSGETWECKPRHRTFEGTSFWVG